MYRFLEPEVTQVDVDMQSMSIVGNVVNYMFLFVLFFIGCYGLYTVIRLGRQRELFPNRLMYPNYCRISDCIDAEGFICYIRPRLTILSIIMLIFGLLFLLQQFVPVLDHLYVYTAAMALPVVAYIWFTRCLKKASRIFW
jgi:hypothetical protein